MNVDYAICHALSFNTRGLPEGLVIYDVGCQWSINFELRVQNSTTLHLPQGLSWITAVGKFHLGTHEQDCFAKFSLNFVHGAGQQDGEILETLWAPLNKIAGSVRAMTKASRQEMIDAQMRDSNWKKTTKIGAVLLHSVQKYCVNVLDSQKHCKQTQQSLQRRGGKPSGLQRAGCLHRSCKTEFLDKTRAVGNDSPWQISKYLSSG
jgi:hypothetical protein